jgi:hypothetical protein
MITISYKSDTRPAISSASIQRQVWTGLLAVLALTLAACGGGTPSASTPNAPPPVVAPPPVPAGTGTVVIRTVTTSGAPIVGATVAINGGFDARTASTDSSGEVVFLSVPVGSASTKVYTTGFHGVSGRLTVTADSTTTVTMTAVRLTEAIPVVLATHSIPSSDGRTLTLDVDLAVLDSNGTAWQTLPASDVDLYGACDWYPCVTDANGSPTDFGYAATVTGATFSPVPAGARPPTATAVLLEQSAMMASFDPSGLRLQAVTAFFDSIAPPDTSTLASYQGVPPAPALTTYGGFTSDAGTFDAAVSALAGHEDGTNPFYTAIRDVIAFTAANTATGAGELRRSVVSVNSQAAVDNDCGIATCGQALLDAATAARTAGISVVAVGPESSSAAWIAARTGGSTVLVQDPAQLPIVFHAMSSIVGHTLAYNRVRIQLDARQPGALLPGGTVWGYLTIPLGSGAFIEWYVPIPI